MGQELKFRELQESVRSDATLISELIKEYQNDCLNPVFYLDHYIRYFNSVSNFDELNLTLDTKYVLNCIFNYHLHKIEEELQCLDKNKFLFVYNGLLMRQIKIQGLLLSCMI